MTALFIGFQKRKVSADRPGAPIEWAARSARKMLADRLACSIRMPPVRSATHFEYFATIFDVSILMDDNYEYDRVPSQITFSLNHYI